MCYGYSGIDTVHLHGYNNAFTKTRFKVFLTYE